MNRQHGQAPPSKLLHPIQRKHSTRFEQCDGNIRQTKGQRLTLTETETLTLISKPGPSRNLPTSNRFESNHSSRNRNKQWRKRKHSSTADGHRQWTSSSRDFSSFKDKFVVVSYNILGVENASKHPELYDKVPRKFLEWEWRKKLICEEINSYNASILCFQEVDQFDDLDDLLQMDGFRGVYKSRTGEACDGCAIFWREKLFTLLHQESIDFQNFGLRNNVAQLCVLKMNQNLPESEEQSSMITFSQNQILVVGNIHVLFNPKRGDIKLGQIRLFLEKAYKLSQAWGGIPVLLAGDLNSSPQSALYQFLASSELDVRQHDRRCISGQFELPSKCRPLKFQNSSATSLMSISSPLLYRWSNEELKLATGSEEVTRLQHQLKLHSAYFGIPCGRGTRDSHGEPLATSNHSQFMGTVDYIWHTEDLLPVRVLETLPVDILRRSGGLPSERCGSDHLALVCELAFANNGDRT